MKCTGQVILILITVLLTICASVDASDGVRLEMPDTVLSNDPFKVTVYVDDSQIRELARKLTIECKGNCPIFVKSDTGLSSSEFEYTGEDKIEFFASGEFRESIEETEGEIVMKFLADPSELIQKFPGLDSYEGQIASVKKGITILPTKLDANLPLLPDGNIFDKQNWDNAYHQGVASFAYTGTEYHYPLKSYTFRMARGACSGKIEGNFACGDFNDEFIATHSSDFIIEKTDLGNFGLGGESAGYVLWNIKKSEDTVFENNAWVKTYYVEVFMKYEALVNKVGFFQGDSRKIFEAKADGIAETINAVKKEMIDSVKSQRWVKRTADVKTHPQEYSSNLPEKKDDKASFYVWGTITDTDANPMPFMKLIIVFDDKKFTGSTDQNGDFKVFLTDIKKDIGTDKFMLIAIFDYVRDGKNYFNVFDYGADNTYKTVAAVHDLEINNGENIEVNFHIDGKDDPKIWTNIDSIHKLKHLSVTYYHMHEAVDFALTKLNADIDYQLPVEVYVGNRDHKTHYDMTDSKILLAADTMSYDSVNRPKNREYHEFGHHVMYSVYDGFPQGRSDPKSVPHDGYLNPNTGDTWTEGFAEFIAMAIAKEVGDKKPQLYSHWGDLEINNYKAWEGNGKLEEFALASLLWDIYDSNNEAGDGLTLSLDDMWAVMKLKKVDVGEYYQAFRTKYPSKSKEIDDLFILHGFFADTITGNGVVDGIDPWKWINQTQRTYFYVDLSSNESSKIVFKQGMIIGKATSYGRPERSLAVTIPNAFVKIQGKSTDFYTIKISFEDSTKDYEYRTEQREGKIYLNPLAQDIDAKITVIPDSDAYTAGKPFSIKSGELAAAIISMDKDTGYVAEHDFELVSTGKKETRIYERYAGAEPSYIYEGDIGPSIEIIKDDTPIDETHIFTGEESSDSKPSFILILIIIVIIGGVAGFIIFKRNNHKSR